MKLGTQPIINQSEKCLKLNFFLKGHDLVKIVIVLFCIVSCTDPSPLPDFYWGEEGSVHRLHFNSYRYSQTPLIRTLRSHRKCAHKRGLNWENVKAFLFQGQSKLSVITRCPCHLFPSTKLTFSSQWLSQDISLFLHEISLVSWNFCS